MFRQTAMFAALATLAMTATADSVREKMEVMFFEHMQKYELDFADGKEFLHRLEIFAEEVARVEKHNADPKKTSTEGLNQFSHMTISEWRDAVRLSTRPPQLRRNPAPVHGEPTDMSSVPSEWDWTTKGAVTPVKNQGQCGSCWSFSTTGSLEGAYYIKYNNLQSFSEQELVSCDTSDNGCNGGWMDAAFDWVKSNGGITTEASYPYTSGTGSTGSCKTSGYTNNANVAPSSYKDVQQGSVSALMTAVYQQPVSVAIQADQAAFKSYSGGVLTGKCGTQLDHGVLAVGYGTLNGVDYWKVKNSWGPSWGDSGYVLIERGSDNKCGILSAASYPVL